MKKTFAILVATLSVSLIVLSLVAPVNGTHGAKARHGGTTVADGVPLPPPTQPPPDNGLIADGVPLPPPTEPPPGIALAG
jgi:hypothetical protein